MFLNNSEAILPPPQTMGKLFSTKLFPGANNVGDCYYQGHSEKIFHIIK